MGTAAAAAVGQEADGRRERMGLIQNLPKRERERRGGPESLKKAGGRPCLTAPFCFLVVGDG